MRSSRRWLAAALLALALLPGLERSLLAHGHGSAGPVAQLSTVPETATPDGSAGCAVCQARATLGSLVVDAHPERHGAAPLVPLAERPAAPPASPRLDTSFARGPPLRIV